MWLFSARKRATVVAYNLCPAAEIRGALFRNNWSELAASRNAGAESQMTSPRSFTNSASVRNGSSL